MPGDIDVIHHPGLIVRDIDATVSQYEKLGFIFTPLSLHRITIDRDKEPVYFGAGNRTAVFEKNFLEIVGIVDPERWSQIPIAQRGPFNVDERLKVYEGLHILHLGADDIEVVRARFQREGVWCSGVAMVQRAVDTPEGEKTMKALSMQYAKGQNPEGLTQIAQHLTAEVALHPHYIRHPNGARLLTEVIICDANPQEMAAKYARYAGRPAERKGALHLVSLPHSRIVAVDPEGLQQMVPGYEPPVLPFLAGITVATNSLPAARDVMRSNRISTIENGARIIVGPWDACGCAVVFEEMGATR
jgi:hypothetical protein